MSCRFAESLPLHLTGALPPQEERALSAHLPGCSDCRADLDALVLLREAGERDGPALTQDDWRRFDEGLRARLVRAKAGIRPTSRRTSSIRSSRRVASTRGRSFAWGWAAAAAALVAFGIYYLAHQTGTKPGAGRPAWSATVASASGEATIARDGGDTPAAAGLAVRPGETVRTGPGTILVLRYDDGSTVTMNENTKLAMGTAPTAKHLRLERGDVYVEAAKQPRGHPMLFNAGESDQATIVGTAFEVSRTAGSTTLRVAEGRVRFGPESRDVLVEAGEASLVTGSAPPSPPAAVELARIAPWRQPKTPVDIATPTESALAGHWAFDEGSGGTCRDSSGHGYDGSVKDATWCQGRTGSAVLLAEGSVVDLTSAPAKAMEGEGTIAAWVKILSADPYMKGRREISPFLAIGQTPRFEDVAKGWRLTLYKVGAHEMRLRFARDELDREGRLSSFADAPFKTAQWRHVAVVVSSAAGGSHRYYLDGRMVASKERLGVNEAVSSGNALQVIAWDGMQAAVDDLRVYRRALSPAEIENLARAGTGSAIAP